MILKVDIKFDIKLTTVSFLAIAEALLTIKISWLLLKPLKTCRHYLKGFKHEVLLLTNHNNFSCFMDTKNFSSRQMWWAQKLPEYHFWINYWRFILFSLTDNKEETIFLAENTQILYWLHNSLIKSIKSTLFKPIASLLKLHLQKLYLQTIYVLSQLTSILNQYPDWTSQ